MLDFAPAARSLAVSHRPRFRTVTVWSGVDEHIDHHQANKSNSRPQIG